MKVRILFLVGAHLGSPVALAGCSSGSSGGKGDAGTPTGGGATAGTGGGTHTVCTQAGQFDQQKAAMHGCTSTVQAECEAILATKPCDSQFQALLTCAEAQPDTSWSCGADGSTTVTGCDPQTAAVTTCATAGTSTTGTSATTGTNATTGATATTTAATASGNTTASTTSGPSPGTCAQVMQIDSTAAAATGCMPTPGIQDQCNTLLAEFPACTSQFQAYTNCAGALPPSTWTCDANDNATFPMTSCTNEQNALSACAQ